MTDLTVFTKAIKNRDFETSRLIITSLLKRGKIKKAQVFSKKLRDVCLD